MRFDLQEDLPLAGLVVLPFVILPWSAEQRELPRFALLGLVAFGGLAVALWRRQLWADRRTAMAVTLFITWLGVVTVLAQSPLRSLFGPYEGHAGALAWAAYAALLLGGPRVDALPRWLGALVAVGAVQGVIGLVQRFSGRAPEGTFGHMMFFAAFSMIAALAAIGWGSDRQHRSQRFVALLASQIAVAGVVLSARRGPLIAFALGFVVLTIAYRGRRRLLPFAGATVLTVVVAGNLIPIPGYDAKPMVRFAEVARDGTVEPRLDTVGQRLDFYAVAARAVLDAPIVGRGFGTFRDRYAQHKASARTRYETRVHDLWLEIALAAGVVGVALLVVALLSGGRAAAVTHDGSGSRAVAWAIGVAYLAHLTVNLDQPGVGAWVVVIVGFLVRAERAPLQLALRPWLAGICAVLAIGFAVRLSADVAFGIGLGEEEGGRDGTAWYQLGVSLAPHECTYRLRAAVALRTRADSAPDRVALLEPCIELEPGHAFAHHHLGLAWLEWPERSTVTLARAITRLDRATQLAPGYAGFHQGLAQALATGSDGAGALGAIERAVALEAQNAGLHSDHGNILLMVGDRRAAIAAYERAVELAPSNPIFEKNLRLARGESSGGTNPN